MYTYRGVRPVGIYAYIITYFVWRPRLLRRPGIRYYVFRTMDHVLRTACLCPFSFPYLYSLFVLYRSQYAHDRFRFWAWRAAADGFYDDVLFSSDSYFFGMSAPILTCDTSKDRLSALDGTLIEPFFEYFSFFFHFYDTNTKKSTFLKLHRTAWNSNTPV